MDYIPWIPKPPTTPAEVRSRRALVVAAWIGIPCALALAIAGGILLHRQRANLPLDLLGAVVLIGLVVLSFAFTRGLQFVIEAAGKQT
jgi:Zn-dependent membrane protease YugP